MAASVKSEASIPAEDKDLHTKIVTQVEYYFGDNNFPRDKFMKMECAKDSGWITIETLLKFNRLKTLVQNMPEDTRIAKIAEVLLRSELVDVDDAGLKVRRNKDLPPDTNSENRTVYLKGFNKTETKLDDLLEFFKKYEGVEAVLMRYYKERNLVTEKDEEANENSNGDKASEPKVIWVKKFKGSIFVVFKTPELAQKLLTEQGTSFKGSDIDVKMIHTEYRKMKRAEFVARTEARNQKRKAEEGKAKDTDEIKKDGPDEDYTPKEDIVKGALMKLTNIPNTFTREDFKEKWYAATSEQDCKIIFADFQKGDTEGIIRLEKEGSAAIATKLLQNGKLKVGEDLFIDIVEMTGDDEKTYLEDITLKRLDRKRKGPVGRPAGRGRGRGRGGKRRRY